MSATKLKPVYREENVKPIGEQSIEQIIGRDASPKIKRSAPVFETNRIDFYRPGLKWLTSLIHYVK